MATLSLKRSARVDSAWPSLMKDGPISCSAAASRSPGRRGSRRRAEQPRPDHQRRHDAQRLQRKQRIVPRQAERHAQQAPGVAKGAQHAQMRQPRVQRHDAQRHVAPGDVGETRLAHALGQRALRQEAADALVQIAVGLGVAGDDAAEERQARARSRRRRRGRSTPTSPC